MKEELRTAFGRITSYTEKEENFDGEIITKRLFTLEKECCGIPVKLTIGNSKYYDKFLHKNIRSEEQFRRNINQNWENLKFFFSFREGEEVGVMYVVREINNIEKNIFRNFFVSKSQYDNYIASTSNFASQDFLTEFGDVVHILKFFSYIILNTRNNCNLEEFRKISAEKNRKVILDKVKEMPQEDKEDLFELLSSTIEDIEYNQEIDRFIYRQVRGINDRTKQNLYLMETGDSKAMLYYMLTNLRNGFEMPRSKKIR
jgi:hypothetical protein